MNRSFTPTTLDPASSTTGGMLDESFRSVALDDADATTVTSRATTKVVPMLEFEEEEDEESPESSTSGSKQSLHTMMSPQAFRDKVKAKSERCRVLMHGQVVSLLAALMLGVQASMFTNCQTFAPAFCGMFAYMLRSLHLIPLFCRGDAPTQPKRCYSFLGVIALANPVWLHLAVAILSVESFYFAMLALKYTTASSVSFLDSLRLVVVMIASRCLFSRRYQKWHVLGAIVCLIGVSLSTLQDYQTQNEQITVQSPPTFRHIQQMGQQALVTVQRKTQENEVPNNRVNEGMINDNSNKFLGDVFALVAGALGGMLDVTAEHMTRTSGNVNEYLGLVGLLAVFVSGIQALVLEQQAIRDYMSGKVCSVELGVSLMVGCSVVFYLQTEAAARFLRKSEAALLNISILFSADAYRTLFAMVAQHTMPLPLFWVGLVVLGVGVFVYELNDPPTIGGAKKEVPSETTGEIPLDIQVGAKLRQK